MATTNSTAAAPTPAQYTLPEAQRQAILAQSPLSIQNALIERQRLAFIAVHGDEFGLDQSAH